MPTLLGHEEPKRALRSLQAHTLLFVGPPRVGRRQVARWYAQRLNCQTPGDEPCGHCESCRLFESDSHPDYRELAPLGETRTGRRSRQPQLRIGDLVRRDDGLEQPLGPWLEARPRFRRRVGVIDGANTLSEAAANAFLKFLEEPPSYAVIILVAPSVGSVLPTIVSRSVPVRFGTVEAEVATPEPHPAARLGRVGDLLEAAAYPDAFSALLRTIDDFLLGLEKGLEETLERADALERAWSEATRFEVAELLRARFSLWPPPRYAAALRSLERCEEALMAYAAPGIAMQVLALELRDILRKNT